MKKRDGLIIAGTTGKTSSDKRPADLATFTGTAGEFATLARDLGLSRDEFTELMLEKLVTGPAAGQMMRAEMHRLVDEVYIITKATDDVERFNALVAEAAKKGSAHKERVLRMAGCRLVNARILYWLPDHPGLLAPEYIWQELDAPPNFPLLRGFCDWWMSTLDGKIKEVITDTSMIIRPDKYGAIAEFNIN